MAIFIDFLTTRLQSPSTIGALLVLVAAYIGYQLVYAHFLSPLCNIPGPRMSRITGRWLEKSILRGEMAKFGVQAMHTFGDIFVCQPKSVVVSDPADIRAVFGASSFIKAKYYRAFQLSTDNSLVTTTDIHKASKLRHMLGPYFTTTYLGRMESHVLHHGARAIVKHWDALLAQSATGQICVNYERTYKMCIFNIISRLVYGQELPTLGSANPEMTRQWLSNATTYIFVRGIMLLTLPNPIRYFATRLWDHRFNPFLKHVSKLIATRKELLETLDEKKEKPPVDLLQALIDCEDPESKMHLTSGQIHSEAMVNLIGGIDTTAFTLTWTTHFLLLYPKCYQRAVHEVRSQFPLSDIETVPDITYNMAKASLPFLEACVYETMRMLPIIQTMFPRMVSEEGITIKGHFLPGGTTVFCNIVGSQLNPKHWQDPHRFNPERFLDPATRRTAINSVFTFGYGGRICMGRNLAWMEMLTMLGNMLRHYDFKIPDEFTHIGPNVIDPDTGHPKLMEKTEFVACTPTYRERDCQILVTRANAE